jgi:hypothetical protein
MNLPAVTQMIDGSGFSSFSLKLGRVQTAFHEEEETKKTSCC